MSRAALERATSGCATARPVSVARPSATTNAKSAAAVIDQRSAPQSISRSVKATTVMVPHTRRLVRLTRGGRPARGT